MQHESANTEKQIVFVKNLAVELKAASPPPIRWPVGVGGDIMDLCWTIGVNKLCAEKKKWVDVRRFNLFGIKKEKHLHFAAMYKWNGHVCRVVR